MWIYYGIAIGWSFVVVVCCWLGYAHQQSLSDEELIAEDEAQARAMRNTKVLDSFNDDLNSEDFDERVWTLVEASDR